MEILYARGGAAKINPKIFKGSHSNRDRAEEGRDSAHRNI